MRQGSRANFQLILVIMAFSLLGCRSPILGYVDEHGHQIDGITEGDLIVNITFPVNGPPPDYGDGERNLKRLIGYALYLFIRNLSDEPMKIKMNMPFLRSQDKRINPGEFSDSLNVMLRKSDEKLVSTKKFYDVEALDVEEIIEPRGVLNLSASFRVPLDATYNSVKFPLKLNWVSEGKQWEIDRIYDLHRVDHAEVLKEFSS